MQKRWSGEDVDLAVLADRTVRFLETMEFDLTELKTERGYEIIAGDSSKYRIKGSISISIEGKPEDFFINLELNGGGKDDRFPLPVMLATMIGGGYFLLKHLKSDEAWVKFEKDFWKEISCVIAGLRGSADSASRGVVG